MSSASGETLGVIFDWDGVVIDSSAHHRESWERLATEEKKALPHDHFVRGFGMKNTVIIPKILGWTEDAAEIHRLSLRKEALYRDVIRERGIAALPGVKLFLDRLATARVPCAIGSSTDRLNIDTIIEVLGFSGRFAAIVSAEDVSHGKPDPEVFLRGAERIGRIPSRCVVFEDAFVGLEAARAGGMKAIAVATTHRAEQLTGKADRVVARLDELSVQDLLALTS